jgi:hypothetical protein
VAIEKPEAAADAVVVALRDAEGRAPRGRLATLGRLEPSGPKLWTLRLKQPARDAKQAWSTVLRESPDAHWVAPAFRDAHGNELLPNGAIVVRFRKRLSDRALEAFAEDNGMRLERRNDFVPEQATFRPCEPREVYLPELVARIELCADVGSAWLATVSRYRKL